MEHKVKYAELTRGDEFIIDGEAWVTKAVDMPGNGRLVIWAVDPKGKYHTMEQDMGDEAVVPIYG
jgi:hypothetical protein